MLNKKLYILLFIILCFLIYILGATDNWVIINFLVLAVCILSFVFDRLFILFLYIIFLPTNGLISTDYNLFGILNLQRLLNLFAIAVFFVEGSKFKTENDSFNKYAIIFLIFFLLYNVFTETKNYFFLMYNTTAENLINRSIKYFLLFGSSILLCKYIKNEIIHELFEFSIIIAVFFFSISHLFSLHLHDTGFLTQGVFEEYYGMQSTEFGRSSGFFGNGDQNSFGTFLAITLGYLCSKVETDRTKFSDILPMLVLITISIVLTGSRTAIAAFIVVLVIFWFRNIKSLKYQSYILAFIFVLIVLSIYTDFFNKAIRRFATTQYEFAPGADSRHAKWFFYLNYLFSDIHNLFIGARRMIFLNHEIRAAHNLLITILFDSGIFFLCYLLFLSLRFTLFAIRLKNKYYLPYIVVPFLMISMIVSDWGYIFYFVFFIALNRKEEQNTVALDTC
jgi:hypothetical protein